jgi:outer membrane protein OmpA-like peptidoglycan-associated protein
MRAALFQSLVVAVACLPVLPFPAVGAGAGQSSTRIPLCAGLTIVDAVNEPQGDYEPIVRIDSVSDDSVSLTYSSDREDGGSTRHVKVLRTVLRKDLEDGGLLVHWFSASAAKTIAGSTAIGLSRAVFRSLRTTGAAQLALVDRSNSALPATKDVHPNIYDHQVTYTLRRVSSAPVLLPVTVNGTRVNLPAIHVRGEHMGDTVEFHILDDESNPISLKTKLTSFGWPRPAESRTVKIAYRCPEAAIFASSPMSRLERALAETGRVDVYDIYFDFNSDRIREESKPTLQEIAELLRKHVDWDLAIEGHTDSIGSDAANLDLSRRRAAAVKNVLTSNHGIDASRLSTGGHGEARPRDRNDTLEGRARNRRVELVRTTY